MKTKDLTFTAIVIAVAIVLNVFSGIIPIFKMPQGGSVVLLSTLLLTLLSVKYGVKIGLIAGFVYGLINFLLGPYFVSPLQLALDYFLAFMAFGLARLFIVGKVTLPKVILAYFICSVLRFLCSFTSGFMFYGEFAGDQTAYMYSFYYNITYILPEFVLNSIIVFIPALHKVIDEYFIREEV